MMRAGVTEGEVALEGAWEEPPLAEPLSKRHCRSSSVDDCDAGAGAGTGASAGADADGDRDVDGDRDGDRDGDSDSDSSSNSDIDGGGDFGSDSEEEVEVKAAASEGPPRSGAEVPALRSLVQMWKEKMAAKAATAPPASKKGGGRVKRRRRAQPKPRPEVLSIPALSCPAKACISLYVAQQPRLYAKITWPTKGCAVRLCAVRCVLVRCVLVRCVFVRCVFVRCALAFVAESWLVLRSHALRTLYATSARPPWTGTVS